MGSLYTDIRKHHLKTWRIWYTINQRCDPNWRRRFMKPSKLRGCYEICDDWSREEQGEQGFINFFDCVGDLEHVSDLHRRDTTKAYSPHNIIKGDPHTRSHHTVYYNTLTAQGMRRAVERGIPKWVYYKRLRAGWSVKRASTVHYTRQRKAA